MQFSERYRPGSWRGFIGNAKAVAQVRGKLADPMFGQGACEVLAIHGPTGVGKTSMAYLIAAQLGAPRGRWNFQEIDGSKCTIAAVQELEADALALAGSSFIDLAKEPWRVVVVNESQDITAAARKAWLTTLERLPARWLVIFTSMAASETMYGDCTEALLARMTIVNLSSQGLAPLFAAALMTAWHDAGGNGELSDADFVRLVKDSKNSLRRAYELLAARIDLARGEALIAAEAAEMAVA